MFSFNEIVFDDITEDVYGKWSQICQECVDKYQIDIRHLDINAGTGICGVEWCNNESDHYIDFPDMLTAKCHKGVKVYFDCGEWVCFFDDYKAAREEQGKRWSEKSFCDWCDENGLCPQG